MALVGKYTDLHDSYMSIAESLTHAGLAHDVDIDLEWVNSETITPDEMERVLRRVSGVLVGPGFGPRGTEGKIAAARFAREHGLPYFGICYGLHMGRDGTRDLCGLTGANSSEIEPESPHPVIDIMPDQRGVDMGGTMRLGLWPCKLEAGTKAEAAYGGPSVNERHRHRFEVNNSYRQAFANAGFIASGVSPDGRLVEIMELTGRSVLRRRAVPSGIPESPDPTPSDLPRIHSRRGQRLTGGCAAITAAKRRFSPGR